MTLNSLRLTNPWPSNSRSNWNLEMLVFEEGGKPENPEKNPQSKGENQQQTQPTYDAGSGNRTRDTLVGGERSDHCATPAPLNDNDIAIHTTTIISYLFYLEVLYTDLLPCPNCIMLNLLCVCRVSTPVRLRTRTITDLIHTRHFELRTPKNNKTVLTFC